MKYVQLFNYFLISDKTFENTLLHKSKHNALTAANLCFLCSKRWFFLIARLAYDLSQILDPPLASIFEALRHLSFYLLAELKVVLFFRQLGMSPLHYAALNVNPTTVETLIDMGADPDVTEVQAFSHWLCLYMCQIQDTSIFNSAHCLVSFITESWSL